MRNLTKSLLVGGLVSLSLGFAAQADETRTIQTDNGPIEITVRLKGPEGGPLPELISGLEFRSEETQALELDDFNNPGMIFVDQAWETWGTADGSAGKACADCHGDPSKMAGVRAVMPKFNEEKGEMYTLAMYINNCRTERMEVHRRNNGQYGSTDFRAVPRHAGECPDRWSGSALLGKRQGNVLCPHGPAGTFLRQLPRGQL
jgi:hypothetical protein